MKLIRILAGIILAVMIFVGAVILRDYLYGRWLQREFEAIGPGMTEEEVISRLGNPSTTYIGDIGPGIYWCYRVNSF